MLLHETQADSWVVKLFSKASQPMKQDMMLSSVIIILKPGHIETNKLENSGRFGQANSYRFIHIIKCQCQFMSKRSIYITKRWPITMHVQIIWNIITLKKKSCINKYMGNWGLLVSTTIVKMLSMPHLKSKSNVAEDAILEIRPEEESNSEATNDFQIFNLIERRIYKSFRIDDTCLLVKKIICKTSHILKIDIIPRKESIMVCAPACFHNGIQVKL